MESFIHADIFFFITSIVVVLLSIFLAILFVYGIRILRDVRHISKRVREESDRIIEDVETIRTNVKQDGLHMTTIISFIGKLFPRGRTIKKK